MELKVSQAFNDVDDEEEKEEAEEGKKGGINVERLAPKIPVS